MRPLVVACLASTIVACGGSRSPDAGSGVVRVQADALVTSLARVARMTLEVTPASVTATLTVQPDGRSWAGNVVVPAGPQVFTVTAYDASDVAVGRGSASVTVVAGVPATVSIRVLDLTGSYPVTDHGPIILSLSATPTVAAVNETVHLVALAEDVDPEDVVTYAWSQSCQGAQPGVFTAPTASATDWSAPVEGTCTITVTVTSRLLSDSASIDVSVIAASAPVAMSVEFIPHPNVNEISVNNAYICRLGRGYPQPGGPYTGQLAVIDIPGWPIADDLSCQGLVAQSQQVLVQAFVELGIPVISGEFTYDLTSDCGGAIQLVGTSPDFSPPMGRARQRISWNWTAPASTRACLLTARATHGGLTDAFPFAIGVAPPP